MNARGSTQTTNKNKRSHHRRYLEYCHIQINSAIVHRQLSHRSFFTGVFSSSKSKATFTFAVER